MSRTFLPRPPWAARLATLALVAVTPLVAACGGGGPAERPGGEPEDPPDQTYTVRGQVVALPGEDASQRRIRVRHEAVPDFVGVDGEVVGMASMTMPFPVAEGLSLEGIETDDKVEMTFEVRWDGSEPLRVVELRELPPGTTLDFESTQPMPGEGEVERTGSQPP